MKFAVVSDLHLGSDISSLIKWDSFKKKYIKGEKFQNFVDAIGKGNDYLIVVGDFLDFAVESYELVYEAMAVFLNYIDEEELAREIIYLPGNHDFNIWHTIEHETNIINKLKKGKSPKKFRMSVPGILDCRNSVKEKRLTLHGVRREKKNYSGYGELFLDYIPLSTNSKGHKVVFNVAYPNLYLLLDDETYIFTHGHYFEEFWSFTGDFLPHIAHDDPDLGNRINYMNMVDLVSVNLPLCQIASTGIGQAGILTEISGKIQEDVQNGKLSLTRKYLNRLSRYIDSKTTVNRWYGPVVEILEDMVLKKAIRIILKALGEKPKTLHNLLAQGDKRTTERLRKYINASLNEIHAIVPDYSNSIKIIFGHTHMPINFESKESPEFIYKDKKIKMYNTGGWVNEPQKGGGEKFCGAEVFLYDSKRGFSSISIN